MFNKDIIIKTLKPWRFVIVQYFSNHYVFVIKRWLRITANINILLIIRLILRIPNIIISQSLMK